MCSRFEVIANIYNFLRNTIRYSEQYDAIVKSSTDVDLLKDNVDQCLL